MAASVWRSAVSFTAMPSILCTCGRRAGSGCQFSAWSSGIAAWAAMSTAAAFTPLPACCPAHLDRVGKGLLRRQGLQLQQLGAVLLHQRAGLGQRGEGQGGGCGTRSCQHAAALAVLILGHQRLQRCLDRGPQGIMSLRCVTGQGGLSASAGCAAGCSHGHAAAGMAAAAGFGGRHLEQRCGALRVAQCVCDRL